MSEIVFPFPAFVCDTGGTNVRFAAKMRADAPLSEPFHLRTDDYPGLIEATRAAAAAMGVTPKSLIACGAGPVDGRTLKLTNAPWLMNGPPSAKSLGLEQGLLLNDFEAQALSLPAIPSDWARQIGPRAYGDLGPQVILGPGTGLGIGALIEASGRHTPLASEACHIDFGPVGAEEEAIWPHLERVHGRVTTESVIAGPGIARIHAARLAARGLRPERLDSAGVAAAAKGGGEAAATLRFYWRIVARLAGDFGVAFAATGGVTLSGGVLPRLLDFLDDDAFRRAFEAKAPVDSLARRIATRLVIRADSVLVGMAAIATAPERYAIDYAARAWV